MSMSAWVPMQRRHLPECHALLVVHAAPRDSTPVGYSRPALEWDAASPPAGPVPGEEPVVEPAIQATRLAKLSAQCLR